VRSDEAVRSEEAVRCSGLVRIHRSPTGEVHALRGVDATFTRGSLTAVVGPSGSGKSTLLEVLALRERPSGGEVLLGGEPTSGLGAARLRLLRRTHVAWVPQRPTHGLYPHLSACDHLAEVAALRGGDLLDPLDALERVGLAARADARPGALSGGEQQRLVVAMAVTGAPAVLVADEPTAELDDDSAALVLAELERCARLGSCVVVSTHDPRVVAAADRVLLLRHGVLSSEQHQGRSEATSVIDSTGRVQLPPTVLDLFPSGRAVVRRTPGGTVELVPAEGGAREAD